MTSKCLYTLHEIYIRFLYHSGGALVPIPHEVVLEYSEMATKVKDHCQQSDHIPKYIEL